MDKLSRIKVIYTPCFEVYLIYCLFTKKIKTKKKQNKTKQKQIQKTKKKKKKRKQKQIQKTNKKKQTKENKNKTIKKPFTDTVQGHYYKN